MVYATNFATGSYYTLSGGESGVDTGCGIFALFMPTAINSTNRVIFSTRTGSFNGMNFILTSTNAIRFTCMSGAGAAAVVNSAALSAGDANKIFLVHGVYTGANQIGLFVNGVQSGSYAACTGYSPSTFPTRIGADGVSGPAGTFLNVFGAGGFRGVPDAAAFAAHYAATRAQRDIATSLTGATVTHAWSVKRSYAGATPDNLTNIAGSGDLAKVGTPTAAVLAADAQVWA